MAIFAQMASMILKEHKHQAIAGDILLIGRQTVCLTVKEALHLIKNEGIVPSPDFHIEIDNSTIGSEQEKYITDRCFFSMFSSGKVIALDISNYENADIIHDLNQEIPEQYYNIADFIFNGSCLDNLFDPATAIKSFSKMLRNKGRIIHLEHGSPIQSAYLCYSPEWFFNFYAINNYVDCQIFICSFGISLLNSWLVNRWVPFKEYNNNFTPMPLNINVGDFVNIIIAEKGICSSNYKIPIQSHYRIFQKDKINDIYIQKHLEFLQSTRNYKFIKELDPNPPFPDPKQTIIVSPTLDYSIKQLFKALLKSLKVHIEKKLESLTNINNREHFKTNRINNKIPIAAQLQSFCGVLRR